MSRDDLEVGRRQMRWPAWQPGCLPPPGVWRRRRRALPGRRARRRTYRDRPTPPRSPQGLRYGERGGHRALPRSPIHPPPVPQASSAPGLTGLPAVTRAPLARGQAIQGGRVTRDRGSGGQCRRRSLDAPSTASLDAQVQTSRSQSRAAKEGWGRAGAWGLDQPPVPPPAQTAAQLRPKVAPLEANPARQAPPASHRRSAPAPRLPASHT